EGERVLTRYCSEMPGQAKTLDQRHGVRLVFVGADRQRVAGFFEAGDGLRHSGIGARLAGDPGTVMLDEKLQETLVFGFCELPLRGGMRAFDHDPPAHADEALEVRLVHDGKTSA